MSVAHVQPAPEQSTTSCPPAAYRQNRANCRPSLRNQTIFERRALAGESLAALALEYDVSHQRIGQIAARVEGWIAAHPEDRLAQRLRLRCRLRYEALYDAAMTGFAASRHEEVTVKQRKTSRPASGGETNDAGETKLVVTTIDERVVRQRHGDPRLLATALKAVEKLERLAAAEDRAAATDPPIEAQPRIDAKPRKKARPRVEQAENVRDVAASDSEAAAEAACADASSPPVMATTVGDVKSGPDGSNHAEHDGYDEPAAENEANSRQEGSSHAELDGYEGSEDERGVQRPIALRRQGPVVLIASRGHIEHMRAVAEQALPHHPILALGREGEARSWLARPDSAAALIWLEEQLDPSGRASEPLGELARQLAGRGAECPVAVEQHAGAEESATLQKLRAAGLRIDVVRRGGEGWIKREWLPAIERLVA